MENPQSVTLFQIQFEQIKLSRTVLSHILDWDLHICLHNISLVIHLLLTQIPKGLPI